MAQRIHLTRSLTSLSRVELRANICRTFPVCFSAENSRRNQSSFSVHDQPSSIVDVSELANRMRQSVREYTKSLPKNKRPRLLGILAHNNGPFQMDAEVYSQLIADNCKQDCIDYELFRVIGEEPSDVEDAIQEGNERADVDGILVYYPIFKTKAKHERGPFKDQLTGVYYKTYDDFLRDSVCFEKDVEGLCQEYNARWMFRARGKDRMIQHGETNAIYPCAALSVLKILQAYHRPAWQHTTVTIVNRSEIFGRPLAAMLANLGATVYSVDIDSILLFRSGGRMRRCNDSNKTLETCIRKSSIVVSGVPSPDFTIPSEWINQGAIFVNVAEYPNVDEEELLDIPGVQYIPHVGKVTISVLEQNLVELHRRYGNCRR